MNKLNIYLLDYSGLRIQIRLIQNFLKKRISPMLILSTATINTVLNELV